MKSSELYEKPFSSINKTILVLDDELEIVTLIKYLLQRHRYRTFGFTNPLLAFEHFMLNSKIIL